MKILSTEVIIEFAVVLSLLGGVATTQYFFLEQTLSQDIAHSEVVLVSKVESIDKDRIADKSLIENHLGSIDDKFQSIDDKFQSINDKFQSINDKFQSVDDRFQRIEDRMDGMERRMESRMDRMESKIDLLIEHLLEKG